MPTRRASQSLYDPRQGDEAIRVEHLRLGRESLEPKRTNYFTIHIVRSGSGEFWADAARFSFSPGSMLCFVPYQHIRLVPSSPTELDVVLFHANFLCVETFHSEVGCSGVLFNDPQGMPVVQLDSSTRNEVTSLLERIRAEQSERGLAFQEVVLANLKVLLILASRAKGATTQPASLRGADPRHPVLIELRELIEKNYQTLHAPADYARLLHVTPKTLGRIARDHLDTTPSELIRGRVLTHAKWQLLHTLKPVKEIAQEVGFTDELYFSRLFKKATGCSPSFFREFETEIRGGSNLSMLSAAAPIPKSAATVDSLISQISKRPRVGA
jgi:AraC-like DNA-binding protein